jgi:hypothetical protein
MGYVFQRVLPSFISEKFIVHGHEKTPGLTSQKRHSRELKLAGDQQCGDGREIHNASISNMMSWVIRRQTNMLLRGKVLTGQKFDFP